MANFKPLLAETIKDTSLLTYPVLASPKLDGIRCVMLDDKAVSRNLKPIPNKYIRTLLEANLAGWGNIDGELMVGDSFQACTSGIMSQDGTPNFTYNVFDIAMFGNFNDRYHDLFNIVKAKSKKFPWLKLVEHVQINSEADLLKYEAECLAKGYEGVMVRALYGKYKNGRSTVKEGILLKLKRFADAEAVVIGMEPLYTNNNEATKDALGHTKRSSKQENMEAQDTLGALRVKFNGLEFNIGTGFDSLTRAAIWSDKKILGKIVKFKYQESGMKEAPRFPVFLGFRDERDL